MMTGLRELNVSTVGIVGAGLIGAGWSARCLARGLDVVATDPAPDAEPRLRAAVDAAWPALRELGLFVGADRQRLRFTASLEQLCDEADFIQESAPEREELKRRLHEDLDAHTAEEVLIASSSSGLLPTRIQAGCRHPERILIGHPFNPVYLLPLVEVVAGERTTSTSVERAEAIYRALGMHPLRIRREIEGYIADRLQEAMWREILHLVNDEVATTAEIDDAILYGPGLRWAFMGTCLNYHLAGGDAGMRGMLQQFGPTIDLPWTRMQAPELSPRLIDRLVKGTDAQAQGRSIEELQRLRDDCLIAILQALRRFEVGAGRTLAQIDGDRDREEQLQ